MSRHTVSIVCFLYNIYIRIYIDNVRFQRTLLEKLLKTLLCTYVFLEYIISTLLLNIIFH